MPLAEITQPPPQVQNNISGGDTPPPAAPETQNTDAPSGDGEGDFLSGLMNKLRTEEGATDEPEAPKEEPKSGEEPEKKEEPAKTDEEPVPKNLTPAAEAKWKEIRAEAKQARAEAAELKARLAEYEPKIQERESKIKELEGQTARLADIDRMKEQIAEYETELSVARIEATPEFKRSVIEPMAAIHARVDKMTAKYEDVDKNTILRALSETDEDKQADLISAFASEWKEKDRVDLYTLGNDYVKISQRRDSMRENAADALKQIQDREAQEQEATVAEQRAEWSRATTTAWEETILSRFKDIPAEEAKELKGKVANLDFNRETAKGRAYAAYAAILLPRIGNERDAALAKVKELETKIAGLQKAKPSGGNGDVIETKKSTETDDRPFLSAVVDSLKG